MRRLYPHRIRDKLRLSGLLEQYLQALQASPLQVQLKALSWDCQIPEVIFRRLIDLQRNPADAANIQAEDFHVVFANIMFRFPTAKMWQQENGELVMEI